MTTNNQETALINSIKKQADDQARKIVEKARQVVEDRKKSTQAQLEKIKQENKEKARQQVETVAQDGRQKIESLKRKQMLGLKKDIVNHVVERVKEKFDALATKPEFKEMMLDWTVEAGLKLEDKAPILKVTDSCKHFADESFCKDAAARYKKITGNEIKFTLSPDFLRKGHGIILEAQNGRTAYNNLLENRLYRHQDTIEALVLEDIFNE